MAADMPDLSMDVRFDRDLAWWRGGSCRYLVAEITSRQALPTAGRSPHDIAIAIGASPSMAGSGLEGAKHLAKGLVNRLDVQDSIAIVSCAGDALVELVSTTADAPGKLTACAVIDRIEPREGSDFAEGWLAAAEQAAIASERHPGRRAVTFVMSDGRADRGLRRSEELAMHAAELRSRGISTAAIAVGPQSDLSLLIAVDDPDGLRKGFAAAVGDDAVDVLESSRLEFTPIVARDVELIVSAPSNAQNLSPLGGEVFEQNEDRLICRLDDFRGSSRRAIVLKAILPQAEIGESAEFAVELAWTDLSGRRRRSDPAVNRVTFVRGRDNTPQQRDPRATLIALDRWRLTLLQELISFNRQGRLREAEAHIARELTFLERYAQGMPGTVGLMNELKLALPMVHGPWRERQLADSASRDSPEN